MFEDGVRDHFSLRGHGNSLKLELYQASDAAFEYHGRNRCFFNRLFAVWSTGKEISKIRNHSEGGKTVEMNPGDLIFMCRGADLEFEFHRSTCFFAFHFNLTAGARSLFSNCYFIDVHHKQDITLQFFHRILNQQAVEAATCCEWESVLLREAASFLPSGIQMDIEDKRFHTVFSYIQNQADATTGVSELAKIFGSSPDTFSRTFSRKFHIPVKQYLNSELVTKADALLRSTTFSIKEVAAALHFSDEFYFSRFFRKNTGVSPSKYRNDITRSSIPL